MKGSSLNSQLRTAINTCPIVYFPTHDYNYVDNLLKDILDGPNHPRYLSRGAIFEYDNALESAVNFYSKEKSDGGVNDFADFLLQVVDCVPKWDIERLFLTKSISADILEDAKVQAYLHRLVNKYRGGFYDPLYTLIIVSPIPVSQIPKSILPLLTIIEIPLPDSAGIKKLVEQYKVSTSYSKEKSEALIVNICRNLQGLDFYDIEQVLRSSVHRSNGMIMDVTLDYVLEEKRKIIQKSDTIDFVVPDVSFEEVGGLAVLRQYLEKDAIVFSQLSKAKDMNIPFPKGVLIMGMPGCGKTLIAKAIANEFKVPLLRLDIGRLMGQYVGQSEENMRRALATAEAAHPCVLWIDEIEKAFHGANSSGGENDSLVMRLMGYFLTWMQERKTAVYIVATANDAMRPEFMRRGRFDQVFFVDFPQKKDCIEIFRSKLRKYLSDVHARERYDISNLGNIADSNDKNISRIGDYLDKFAGSEIECVVDTVFKEKFIQHPSWEKTMGKISITINDFITVANNMKDNIMSAQKNPAIDRIRDLQNDYNFPNAAGK